MKYGANVNARNDINSTPLHTAVEYSHSNGLHQKKLSSENQTKFKWRKADSGKKHYEIIKLLLKNKADSNIHSQDGGMTPLHIATIINNIDMVKLLLSEGSNINAIDETSSTALHRAVASENYEITKILLENGANKNLTNRYGLTPSDISAKKNNQMITRLLDSEI